MDGNLKDARPEDRAPGQAIGPPKVLWRAFGASVIGLSHISRGVGNQDAVHWYPADDGLDKTGLPAIIAVSDGHGESACVRSDRGARFAVEIAIDVLRQFASDIQFSGGNSVSDVKEFAPRLLKRQISERWTSRVLADSDREPFSTDELMRLTGIDDQLTNGMDKKKRLKAYGCTVLAVLATTSFLVALQVGDGAIVVAYSNGMSRSLIPPHEANFGNETTSLCSDPVDMAVAVHGLEANGPVVVMACTDGYEKAIDTEYFRETLLGEYVEYFRKRHGWREIYKDLPSMLEEATSKGSGDDTTVAFLVSSALEGTASEAVAPLGSENTSVDTTVCSAASVPTQIPVREVAGDQYANDMKVPQVGEKPTT